MSLTLAAILLIPVTVLMILPLWIGRTERTETGERASGDEEWINLGIERESLLGTLADLEVDHSQGKFRPEEYLRLKRLAEQRLLQVLEQLGQKKRAGESRVSGESVQAASGRFRLAGSLLLALLILSGTAGFYQLVYGKIARSQMASGEEANGPPAAGPPVNPVEMVARLEKRLKENPNDLEGQMMAGRSYVTLQRWDDAKRAWKKAVELDGRNEIAQFNYADVLLRTAGPDDRKVYQEALAHLDLALMKVPREPVVLWTKGVALLHLGRNQETDQVWTEAYQYLPPGSKDADFVKQALQNLRSGKVPLN